MITRDEFPYLQELIINDAYAVKNLTVPVFQIGEEFKHLILTGRNGSGKTTVLREINSLWHRPHNTLAPNGKFVDTLNPDKRISIYLMSQIKNEITINIENLFNEKSTIISFFEANRQIKVLDVSSVLTEDSMNNRILNQPFPGNTPSELFKQYLVNKKIFQIFDEIDGNKKDAERQAYFFEQLDNTFKKIFNDVGLNIEFLRKNFDFYINLSDGRRFTFNQLSAGYSAFLNILTDLLVRTDLLREQANDYTYNPCGFVLIDEPETHLHLEMQYQILPLLTSLFPNLQFIVATHSPAVASSIKNATVFDLSTGEAMGDEAAGSSFSELMQTHFGVENEYSNVGDAILDDIKEIVKIADHEVARKKLLQLLEEKGKYMSDGLKLEVEAQLIGLE